MKNIICNILYFGLCPPSFPYVQPAQLPEPRQARDFSRTNAGMSAHLLPVWKLVQQERLLVPVDKR
jgi:hypothetical protein